MCGIVAIHSYERPIDEDALARATRILRHRGSDDESIWLSPDGRIGLGHRRLSIIDLATGRQPVTNETESIDPEVQAADEHDDGADVEERPEDFHRRSAVVAEMQWLRQQQQGYVPGQITCVRQLPGLRVDERRFEQSRRRRGIAAHKHRVMMVAGEQRAGKGYERRFHLRQGRLRRENGAIDRSIASVMPFIDFLQNLPA